MNNHLGAWRVADATGELHLHNALLLPESEGVDEAEEEWSDESEDIPWSQSGRSLPSRGPTPRADLEGHVERWWDRDYVEARDGPNRRWLD